MVKVDSEKELENFLANTLAQIPNMWVERQIRLGRYGRADILAWTVLDIDGVKTLLGHVVEVKKEAAGLEAVYQLCRYVKGIEVAFINVKNENPNTIKDAFVIGSVFCKEVIGADYIGYLLAQMQNLYIYKYAISIKKGLKARRWPGWIHGVMESYQNKSIINENDLLTALEKSTENICSVSNYYNPFLSICI